MGGKKSRSQTHPTAGELARLVTESADRRHVDLDTLDAAGIAARIHGEMAAVWPAVEATLPQVARLADWAAEAFRSGGRLLFAGAGTSGRLGVLEAAECPPTFGVSPGMVAGLIAGGRQTLVRSREGVEDERQPARQAVRRLRVGPSDILVGLTASRRTPYVVSALDEARRRGARTALIHCNPPGAEDRRVDLVIAPQVGPEVIAGSTRMKSGTAQKLILNILTTTAMIRSGRVFGNLMVDLQARSFKLRERSLRLVQQTTGLDRAGARRALRAAGGRVKLAILMELAGVSRRRAVALLKEHAGFLRRALEACGVDAQKVLRRSADTAASD
ncbi:MAG: N-acetylmuramic acid 6-phosphate etherase [Candidatus Eisenbacteria bacterium]|nr:N-acetylmuramic acid 6-phosphate etherase [Candidatus Eisenbacteria bacterium]